ncbi:(Fe-S)-binding protein [Archaeoglobus sp.]|uniref:(Fe-S)-binding protein n=1 Tax=Archaeoglobus sp. TaxID=1872626 RepID=UPI0025BA24B6|nr:(Fe-S)-binding protein [Archaeoglobus sp.]
MMEKVNYAEIVHRCFRCGYCKFPSDYSEINCPSYAKYRFETYFSGGRMWLIRAWMNNEIEWSEHLGEIMYSCSTCRNCVEHCVFKFNEQLVDVFIAARSDMVERGQVPKKVGEFFSNLAKFGNPWGYAARRLEWVGRDYANNEFLLHAGCVATYDDRAKRSLKALLELLDAVGVDYGVFSDEICEGNEAMVMGEFGLFEQLMEQNRRRFEERGVKKVLTPDPHAFNAFKNYYGMDAVHHTQLLWNLVNNGELKVRRVKEKLTYHDPCFLGRWNGVYKEPRKLLSRIGSLYEMPRNRKDSFCCGGGSGNFYTDYLGGKDSPARIRVKEAAETAEILVTSCPVCLMMLDNAVSDEGLELEVRDISEVVLEALKS